MLFVRKGVRLGAALAVLVLLIALALYLWLRPSATSPAPADPPVAPSTPQGAEKDPEPSPELESAAEEGKQAQATPVPVAPSVSCLEGICVVSLELPPPLGIPIHFVDDSLQYDWTVASQDCLAAMGTFIQQKEMVWSEMTFNLRDELSGPGTPIEFQYPPSEDPLNDPAPDAVMAQCSVDSGDRSQVTCQVQVQWASDLPNSNMAVALIAGSLDGLRRVHHEEFTGDLEPFYHFSEMEIFEPVVVDQGEDLQSQCLQVLGSSATD